MPNQSNDYLWEVYNPAPFNIDDRQTLIAFCRKIAFGTIITSNNNSVPIVSYVPFIVKEIENDLVLEFHLAIQNEHSSILSKSCAVGISVMGEHGYISSSVYNHVNVPTYNYEAVYLTGQSYVLDEFDFSAHLAELVDAFEKDRNKPLHYHDFPADMISAYKKEIVGIRVKIDSIKGAFKLSQNRNKEDLQAILNDNSSNPKLCSTMLKHYKK
jgi:transcriptional regulator